MEAVKTFFKNDIVERALKTFVQAFLASMLVSISQVSDLGTVKAALLAASAAGVSAVWNTVIAAGRQ